MVPACAAPAPRLGEFLRAIDPVVRRYRAFFAQLDWSRVPERDSSRPWPGPIPHPRSAYVKALLVKICEEKRFVTDLRTFLVEHPPLVLELGFRPVVDLCAHYGFNVEATVPGDRWLRGQQQTIDDALLTNLLAGTVVALRQVIPHLGETVAYDVKHIYAWVCANNPKAFVAHRFDPTQQPIADSDCRLGIKRRRNQANPDGTQAGPSEPLWGYGTGVASATVPGYGDVVLAEVTQPFNANDITYFAPLHARTVAALGQAPHNITADAAFDAWYVYDAAAQQGGIAAIPLNQRGKAPPNRDPAGVPRCAEGLRMVLRKEYAHEDGYRAQRYGCPYLRPRVPGQTCAHPLFAEEGCTRIVNLAPGGLMRVNLDRTTAEYAAIYRQRTSAERINSQATAWGIERPMVRNQDSVRHLNTLTYITINARTLQRIHARNAAEAGGSQTDIVY